MHMLNVHHCQAIQWTSSCMCAQHIAHFVIWYMLTMIETALYSFENKHLVIAFLPKRNQRWHRKKTDEKTAFWDSFHYFWHRWSLLGPGTCVQAPIWNQHHHNRSKQNKTLIQNSKIQNEMYVFQFIIFVPNNKKDETCRENNERDPKNEKEKKEWKTFQNSFGSFICNSKRGSCSYWASQWKEKPMCIANRHEHGHAH